MNGEVFKHDPDEEEWVDPTPTKKRGAMRWVTSIVFFLALYVLSIGPVIKFAMSNNLPNSKPMEYFYAPISMLANSSPTFRKALGIYLDWWLSSSEKTSIGRNRSHP
jgi:hypothetical protein